jgi:hypothetical protein
MEVLQSDGYRWLMVTDKEQDPFLGQLIETLADHRSSVDKSVSGLVKSLSELLEKRLSSTPTAGLEEVGPQGITVDQLLAERDRLSGV